MTLKFRFSLELVAANCTSIVREASMESRSASGKSPLIRFGPWCPLDRYLNNPFVRQTGMPFKTLPPETLELRAVFETKLMKDRQRPTREDFLAIWEGQVAAQLAATSTNSKHTIVPTRDMRSTYMHQL